ncbi:MAG: hypothetical protein AVDCRST_MAG96-3327, partial [uncultured Segetibacter sp.]
MLNQDCDKFGYQRVLEQKEYGKQSFIAFYIIAPPDTDDFFSKEKARKTLLCGLYNLGLSI